MTKISDPLPEFEISKRIGQKILLKKRKEGFTVSYTKEPAKPIFFEAGTATITTDALQERWNNLSAEEKTNWEASAAVLSMTGETLFKMQEKKSMVTGFYNYATYGGTKIYGILLTIYSTVYNLATYGKEKYRKL